MIDLRSVFNNINKKDILTKLKVKEENFYDYFINKKNNLTHSLLSLSIEIKMLKRNKKEVESMYIFCKEYIDILNKNPKYQDYEKDLKSLEYYQNLENFYKKEIINIKNKIVEKKTLKKDQFKELFFLYSCCTPYFSASEFSYIKKRLNINSSKWDKIELNQAFILSEKILNELEKMNKFFNIKDIKKEE